eukprot:CAMPEP_0195126872 /NCGR_PEP_ID=MMETSP0448-20130528/135861_1 /TAXON_ID=66468 /ORGANISM="Heterocapsa triquestra, Strain CCMP 448" /LENGTH=283 /DNA_ID=CAMNT_0040164579 /DNA_START=42 /DNA_END=894 /DNA_ORIENTATION=-
MVVGAACLPLWGLCHFLTRPRMWVQVFLPIVISCVTTIASFSMLIGMALKPQEELLLEWGWPVKIAWVAACLLILAEVAIVNLVIIIILFGCVQTKLFHDVLQERGVKDKIRARRFAQLGTADLPEANCARDLSHNLLFLAARLPLLIMTLPLHAVPVAGQIAWVMLNGWLYAWELETDFMIMVEERHRCGEQFEFVKARFGSFMTFGAVAMALELVPFLGPWIFFAANGCGAAYLAEKFWNEMKDYAPPTRRLVDSRLVGDEGLRARQLVERVVLVLHSGAL